LKKGEGSGKSKKKLLWAWQSIRSVDPSNQRRAEKKNGSLLCLLFWLYSGVEDDDKVEERSRNVKWGLCQKTQRLYIGQTQSLLSFLLFLSQQTSPIKDQQRKA